MFTESAEKVLQNLEDGLDKSATGGHDSDEGAGLSLRTIGAPMLFNEPLNSDIQNSWLMITTSSLPLIFGGEGTTIFGKDTEHFEKA